MQIVNVAHDSIGRLLDERYVTRNAYWVAPWNLNKFIWYWKRSVNVCRKETAPRFLLS